MNGTMEHADLPVLVKPGTDGALACAVMHCLFRDGKADWPYLDKYTDAPRELEAHLRTRGPDWASAITGAPVETIEQFAKLIGAHKRAFFRLGYGFRVRAMARRTCTRPVAFRPLPVLGSMKVEAPFTLAPIFLSSMKRLLKGSMSVTHLFACSISRVSEPF